MKIEFDKDKDSQVVAEFLTSYVCQCGYRPKRTVDMLTHLLSYHPLNLEQHNGFYSTVLHMEGTAWTTYQLTFSREWYRNQRFPTVALLRQFWKLLQSKTCQGVCRG